MRGGVLLSLKELYARRSKMVASVSCTVLLLALPAGCGKAKQESRLGEARTSAEASSTSGSVVLGSGQRQRKIVSIL